MRLKVNKYTNNKSKFFKTDDTRDYKAQRHGSDVLRFPVCVNMLEVIRGGGHQISTFPCYRSSKLCILVLKAIRLVSVKVSQVIRLVRVKVSQVIELVRDKVSQIAG